MSFRAGASSPTPGPALRYVAVAALAMLAVVLAAMQFCAGVALREVAQPGSWPRFVPAALAARIDDLASSVPAPPVLRRVLVKQALARGDLPEAARQLALVKASPDRLVLEGDLAEARGDLPSAVRAYLAAGDLPALQARVDSDVLAGDLNPALALESEIVARLEGVGTQTGALAEGSFQLGLLLEARALLASSAFARRADERRSEDAYRQAATLAPLDERYLLGLGNQQLNRGELAAAQSTFTRGREADPSAAEPLTGMGEVSLRRGARALAQRYLERARLLVPDSPAVRRLAEKLARH